MQIKVTKNCITVIDCYEDYSKKTIKCYLKNLRETYPEYDIFKRSDKSLMREWRAHARLYKLGLYKEHTKDCDMEYPIERKYEIIWNLIGI